MRRPLCLLLLAMFGGPVPRAAAWNELGHMTVAKLAWEQLTARHKDAAYETLRHLPYCDKFMSERPRPTGVSPAEWLFLNASTWPDWLRDFTKTGKRPDTAVSKYHIGPRHYINLPVRTPQNDVEAPAAPMQAGDEESIVTGIRGALRQLREPGDDREKRALALAWLLHLTGDIHQPLHCGSFLSKQYPPPGGDLGGNLCWVKTPEGPTNLHAFWDDLLGKSEGYGRAPFDPLLSDRMWDRVREQYGLLRGEAYARETYGARPKATDAWAWALEGNALSASQSYVFRGMPLRRYPIPNYYQLSADAKQAESAKAPALPDGYVEASLTLARRQVALAGHRLADQLRRVFAAGGQER